MESVKVVNEKCQKCDSMTDKKTNCINDMISVKLQTVCNFDTH